MTKTIVGIVLVGAFLVAPSTASAQMSLAQATVSAEVAKTTLLRDQINANVARQLVDACLEFAKTQPNGPGTYAIFVLSPTGDLVDGHVMDGVFPIGAETGLMKAQTALYARTPSSVVANRFPTLEGRAIRMDLGKQQGLSYYFVGGGNRDEQCAYTALTKVLGPQPPLPQANPPAGGGREGGAGRGAPPAGGAPAGGGRGGRGAQ